MQFIIILRLQSHYRVQGNWTADTNRILGEHWNYLVDLNEKGIIKLVGRTDYNIEQDENIGIAIFEAPNKEKAVEILNNDPCMLNSIMSGEVHPLSVLMYNGKVLEH